MLGIWGRSRDIRDMGITLQRESIYDRLINTEFSLISAQKFGNTWSYTTHHFALHHSSTYVCIHWIICTPCLLAWTCLTRFDKKWPNILTRFAKIGQPCLTDNDYKRDVMATTANGILVIFKRLVIYLDAIILVQPLDSSDTCRKCLFGSIINNQ